ncbi:MAG: ATP-binding protein [Candidatus Eisenbacteria sp.]|nr:ATP-binding protein [Candidatus Eisenbacteria bacterium]
MKRAALEYLVDWKAKPSRKPLVVRGARQVGKSYLVEQFGDEQFDGVVRIDFERDPDIAELFDPMSPREIIRLLEVRLGTDIVPGQTLLFLDEIQAAPKAFAALRYFHEELPQLHVIAAGSLLEFLLGDEATPVPVGRVEYLHLGPMQFEEFLLAGGHTKLLSLLNGLGSRESIPESIHVQLMRLVRQFFAVGGMPEVVRTFIESGSLRACDETKRALLTTFQEDFAKYRGRFNPDRLRAVFARVPALVGMKFKYVHVDPEQRSRDLKPALDALCHARIAHRVPHSSCSGIPLGATASQRHFKVLFMDVGLLAGICGLNLVDFEQAEDIMQVNAGAVCEQYVGQHLLYSLPPYCEPGLHFWTREAKTSSAEVDYVISEGPRIIPIEVKAGKTGTLRSLHRFLHAKRCSFAVRLNADRPSLTSATVALPEGDSVSFELLSLPLYMAGQVRRLCGEWSLGDIPQR